MLDNTQDTTRAWNTLLACLDVNPRAAAEKYESIRVKLVRIFRGRGHTVCEELADRVIDRVAKRLDRGLVLWPGQEERYFLRVAHFMSLEASREKARARRVLKQLHEPAEAAEVCPAQDERLASLEARVRALSADDRRMLVLYYEGEGQVRIQNRRRLAAECGLSLNTLRVRMFRLRAELERTLEGGRVKAAA